MPMRIASLAVLVGAFAIPAAAAQAHHSAPATYSGAAASGGTVEFDVSADSKITRFKVTNVATTCGTVSLTFTGSVPIVDHAFNQTSGQVKFNGSFPSSQQAQGSLYLQTAGAPSCRSQDVAWTAATSAPPSAQCSDTADNDGDAKVDHPADPGCADPSDPDESDPPPAGPAPGPPKSGSSPNSPNPSPGGPTRQDKARQPGSRAFKKGFLNKVWRFDADVDGFDHGACELNVTILKVLNLPKKFKVQDDELIDEDGLVLCNKKLKVFDGDGDRVGLSALEDASRVVCAGKLLRASKWRKDEDGEQVPTIRAKRCTIKATGGAGASSPAAFAAAMPRNGVFRGRTAQGKAISLTVKNGTVRKLVYSFKVGGCGQEIETSGKVRISMGKFTHSSSQFDPNTFRSHTTTIQGSFATPTSVKGTINAKSPCGSKRISYSARRS